MGEEQTEQATRLLDALDQGEADAAEHLLPIVYDKLRALAGAYFRGQPGDHTLEPTALVHEAYVRLIDRGPDQWKSRTHFLAVAARAMRQILTDHARAKHAAKRGAGWHRVTFASAGVPEDSMDVSLLDLDSALTALEELNPRHAEIVQLRFFGGLTMEQIARLLGLGRATVDNDWRVCRAWLSARLSGMSGQ